MIKAISAPVLDLPTGSPWVMVVEAGELPTLAIVSPDGSPVSPVVEFEADGSGCYRAEYAPTTDGRYVAVASTATEGTVIFQAFTQAITLPGDEPDAAELSDWLGGAGSHSWSDPDLTHALTVEMAAQRRVCRIPAAYPTDLREALLRRAARNLEMRRQLTEQTRTDSDFGVPALVPPGRDQEVRRLEAPFKRVTVG